MNKLIDQKKKNSFKEGTGNFYCLREEGKNLAFLATERRTYLTWLSHEILP